MIGCFSNESTNLSRLMVLTAALTCLIPTNLPAQWSSAGGPFGGSVVALAADSQRVYVGTTQGHVWRASLSDIVTAIRAQVLPPRQALGVALSSYPNPCNASTVLTFSLPQASRATLLLKDILGRNVITVLDRRLDAGPHQLRVELTYLSSGTYFAVLTAGENRAVSRLLLIR
jgi:hypothetical protein